MKKVFAIVGASMFVATLSFAQQPEQTPQTWDPKKNATVQSLTTDFESKLVAPPQALTTEKIFPVLGQYESSLNTDAANVKIMMDEQNKGIVWIEGLPQGKIKAFLRKSPATYKIPAQKTEDGKDVAEGTLIFDKETNQLNIVIGKAYNMADPASVFAAPASEEMPAETTEEGTSTKGKSKTKSVKSKKPAEPKAWTYVGTKVVEKEKDTADNN